jgi:hypothetical protein
MRAGQATVVDIAAYLGVTPRRVRQIVAEHGIQPTGTRWKAKLYDPREILKHAPSNRGDARPDRATLPVKACLASPERAKTPARRQPPGAWPN